MANASEIKVRVQFFVDNHHTQPWRFRLLEWVGRRLGIILVNVDAEFAA